MSRARSIGELIGPVMARASALYERQRELNDMETPTERKAAVIRWHCLGYLSKEDTQLLFDVYELAEA